MYSSTLSLTSALDWVGGQRHAPAALPPGKRPGTHCIGGWVGLRAGMDGYGNARPHRDSNCNESLYRQRCPGAQNCRFSCISFYGIIYI